LLWGLLLLRLCVVCSEWKVGLRQRGRGSAAAVAAYASMHERGFRKVHWWL